VRTALSGAGTQVVVGEQKRRIAELLHLTGEFTPLSRVGGVGRLNREAERLPVHSVSVSPLREKVHGLYIFVSHRSGTGGRP